VEGGWVAGSGIFLYRNGYFVVVEDSTLSVRGRGTPNATSLGWRGGGVKTGSKTNKVIATQKT
jgi:hypothetical protein